VVGVQSAACKDFSLTMLGCLGLEAEKDLFRVGLTFFLVFLKTLIPPLMSALGIKLFTMKIV
jgi:hypothetical protein